jgi:hypothetical protein
MLMSGACDPDDTTPERAADGGADAEQDESYLGLAKPRDGFQIRSIGAEIKPGEDVELCEVGRLPGDSDTKYIVKSFEFGNEKGSHHLIVSAAVAGSPAEPKLEALGVGNSIPCFSAENAFGNQSFTSVGGSQQPYVEIVLPDRVGREFHGGQLVVFDYHYLNTRENPIQARSAVNFHLTDADSIDHIAKGFSFSNYLIATQPHAQGSFTGECHFRNDVMLGDITRHTHRWGTDFSVWFSGGAREGEPIWTSHDWQHDTFYEFDSPILMRAGEGLRFRCGYVNDTERTLRYGTNATDEMCILFGTIWEADGDKLPNQSCTIVWQDADGIGHPATEAGGFPPPKPAEVSACLSASADTACARCRCESCATPAIQCALDANCKAISDCYVACPTGTDCNAACRDAIDSHSSGLGALTQRSSCFQTKCESECL